MGGIVCPCMGTAMDSASLLACLLWPLCHAPTTLTPNLSRKGRGSRVRLCHACRALLSCPLGPSVHLAGSLCPSCWVPLSIPLGPPLSILPGPSVHPAGSPVHPAGSPVHPAGPPLSFPPVVSGNPVSFFSVPLFGWPCMGKAVDSRLKMSGMTEGGLETWGVTEGGLETWGVTEGDWKRGE